MSEEFSFAQSETPSAPAATSFSNGWTIFPIEAMPDGGFKIDIMLRTSRGVARTSIFSQEADVQSVLATPEHKATLVEPGTETSRGGDVVGVKLTFQGTRLCRLTSGKTTWVLQRGKGKQHWFAYLTKLAPKGQPVDLDALDE